MFSGYKLTGGWFTRRRRKGSEDPDEAGDLDEIYGRVKRVTALGPYRRGSDGSSTVTCEVWEE
jgi:hypothetical protein